MKRDRALVHQLIAGLAIPSSEGFDSPFARLWLHVPRRRPTGGCSWWRPGRGSGRCCRTCWAGRRCSSSACGSAGATARPWAPTWLTGAGRRTGHPYRYIPRAAGRGRVRRRRGAPGRCRVRRQQRRRARQRSPGVPDARRAVVRPNLRRIGANRFKHRGALSRVATHFPAAHPERRARAGRRGPRRGARPDAEEPKAALGLSRSKDAASVSMTTSRNAGPGQARAQLQQLLRADGCGQSLRRSELARCGKVSSSCTPCRTDKQAYSCRPPRSASR